MRWLPICFLSLTLCVIAVDDDISISPVEFDAVIKRAEDSYLESVRKADDISTKLKSEARAKRLAVYEQRLQYHIKAGDTEKATAIKSAIKILKDAEGQVIKAKPKDTLTYDGHFYAVFNESVTWHVAQQKSEEMGGHLLTIDNSKELKFITAQMTKEGNPRTSSELWIGGSDEETEGELRWVNGESVNLFYAPNYSSLRRSSVVDYLVWNSSSGIEASSEKRTGFICEWDH